MNDFNPDDLAPGIRRTVLLLRSWGYDTIDSGDGMTNLAAGMECARDYPHVSMRLLPLQPHTPVFAAIALSRQLRAVGIEVGEIGSGLPAIQASYDPVSDVALLELMDLDDAKLPGGVA